MATRKITITVEEVELDRIRDLVAAGSAKSVSGFVQQAVKRSLDADRLLADYLDSVLAEGGPLTAGENAWLDELFPTPQ